MAADKTSSPIVLTSSHHLSFKLTPQNFLSWRAQFDALLTGFDLCGYIDGSHPAPPKEITNNGILSPNPEYIFWFRQDKLILHAIFASASESVLSFIATFATSHEAWQTLISLYASKTKSRIMDLKNSLHSTRKDNKPVVEYLHQMKQLVSEINLAGAKIENDDLVLHILNGLGPDYREIAAALRARETTISFDELHEKLTAFELFLKQESSTAITDIHVPTAHVTKKSSSASHQRFSGSRRPSHHGERSSLSTSSSSVRPICQICDRVGHSAKQCFRGKSFFNSKPVANLAASSATGNSWCLDSGASHHVTSKLDDLHLAEEYDGTKTIKIGDGTGLSITHQGSTNLSSTQASFTLKNVYCVPQITQNLVSVSKFCKQNNVSVEFDANALWLRICRHTQFWQGAGTLMTSTTFLPVFSRLSPFFSLPFVSPHLTGISV